MDFRSPEAQGNPVKEKAGGLLDALAGMPATYNYWKACLLRAGAGTETPLTPHQ